MAKEDPFWEMMRALVLAIGWIFSAIFSLFAILIDSVSSPVRESRERRMLEEAAKYDAKTKAGPHGETSQLKAQAATVIQKAAFPTTDDFLEGFFERYVRDHLQNKTFAAWGVRHPMLVAAHSVYAAEAFDRPPSRLVVTGQIEAGQYRDELIAHIKKLSDPGRTLAIMTRCMIDSCNEMTKRLPPIAISISTTRT